MFGAIKQKTSAIGLDVGSRCFKAVQLEGVPGHRRVRSAVVLPRVTPGGALTTADAVRLRDVLDRRGFAGKQVTVNIPNTVAFSQILELPPANVGAPTEQIARFELARSQNLEAQGFEMAYWNLPSGDRPGAPSSVYATGCRHEDADALISVLEAQGLDVGMLTTPSCGAVRACFPLLANSGGVTCVLDVGWRAADLMMVYNGAIFYERRHEEAGLRVLYKKICERFNVSDEMAMFILRKITGQWADADQSVPEGWDEFASGLGDLLSSQFDALAHELEISCSYAQHQHDDAEIDRLLLVGGGATQPGLAERLEAALSVPVKVVCPGDVADCSMLMDMNAAGSAALTAALGLACCNEGSRHVRG